MPCLRRATAVNYTDADEDAEKLMSFLDEVSGHSMLQTPDADIACRLRRRRMPMGRHAVARKTGWPPTWGEVRPRLIREAVRLLIVV